MLSSPADTSLLLGEGVAVTVVIESLTLHPSVVEHALWEQDELWQGSKTHFDHSR